MARLVLFLRAALALRAALTLPAFTTAALATLLIATAAAAPLVTTTAVAAWRFHRRLFLPGRLLRTRADAEQAHQLGPDAFASAGRLHHNLYRRPDDVRCPELKGVGMGKGVSVQLALGGGSIS